MGVNRNPKIDVLLGVTLGTIGKEYAITEELATKVQTALLEILGEELAMSYDKNNALYKTALAVGDVSAMERAARIKKVLDRELKGEHEAVVNVVSRAVTSLFNQKQHRVHKPHQPHTHKPRTPGGRGDGS